MTDEEKKALDMLNKFITEHKLFNIKQSDGLEDNILIILNLIEKQFKEIEGLKMITKEYDSFLGNEKIIIADKSYFDDGYFKEKFISKDKIKAKIEEIQQRRENDGECELALHGFQREAKIEVLQSLLEKEWI